MRFAPGSSDWVVGAVFGGTYQREGLELRDRQFPSQSLTKKEKFLLVLLQTRVFVENGGSGTSVALHTNK